MVTIKSTLNPIIKNEEFDENIEYSSLDGKSQKNEITNFQKWMLSKHPTFNKDGDIVLASGVFDDGTKAAWNQYGAEYTGVPTAAEKKANAKKGINWDKAKGWVSKAAAAGKSSGFFDYLKLRAGMPSTEPIYVPPVTPYAPYSPSSDNQPMSKTTKIIIASTVGVILLGLLYVKFK